MSNSIILKGKLDIVIRSNIGALAREVIKNGEDISFDFSRLYIEERNDINNVEVIFPDGQLLTAKRNKGRLVSGTKTIFTEYRYKYSGYDVKAWWDRVDDEIIRGAWPGYTVLCRFYSANDVKEGKVYFQIQYETFKVEDDSFELCDAQLTDDGTVSYVMKNTKSGAMFAVQSGDWKEDFAREERYIIKKDDYPEEEEEEGVGDIRELWWGESQEIVSSITPTFKDNFVNLKVENNDNISEILLCYVNCTKTPISDSDYTETVVNCTKDVERNEDSDTISVQYDVSKFIESGDVYRVRFLFRGFSGEQVFTKSCAVSVLSEEEHLEDYWGFSNSFYGQDTREFVMEVKPEKLKLEIGRIKSWLPTIDGVDRNALDVVYELTECFQNRDRVEKTLYYLSKEHIEQCNTLMEEVNKFHKYWQYLNFIVGDKITQLKSTEGQFVLYGDFEEGEGEEKRTVLKQVPSMFDVENWQDADNEILKYDKFLETIDNLQLVYEYRVTMGTSQFEEGEGVTHNICAYFVNVAFAPDVSIPDKYEGNGFVVIKEQAVPFHFPMEGNVTVELESFTQVDKFFKFNVFVDERNVLMTDIDKVEVRFEKDPTDILLVGKEMEIKELGEGKYEVGVLANLIPDVKNTKATITLSAGKYSVSAVFEGVSFSYKTPEITVNAYGCYDKLVVTGEKAEYKMQMFVQWEVLNKNLVSWTEVELLNRRGWVVDRGSATFYKDEVQRDGSHKMYFFINFTVENREEKEGYMLSLNMFDVTDEHHRNGNIVITDVKCYNDYIVEHGFHRAFGAGVDTDILKILVDSQAFFYAWDMHKETEVLDRFKDEKPHAYYEVLVGTNGAETLKKVDYLYIKNNTLSPFSLSYKVKMYDQYLFEIGDYMYEVYHQTGDYKETGQYNTNTFYRKRTFRLTKEGENFYRYDTVPIMIDSHTDTADFIPTIRNNKDLVYEHIDGRVLVIDEDKIAIDPADGELEDSTFENTFDDLTFKLQKRDYGSGEDDWEDKVCDLVWVSSEKIDTERLILIHNFNSNRTLRNITDKMKLQTRTFTVLTPYVDENGNQIVDDSGNPMYNTETKQKSLYVYSYSFSYKKSDEKYYAVVMDINPQNKTTFLCWKVDARTDEIKMFNSNDLENPSSSLRY